MVRALMLNIWARFGDWPGRRAVLQRCLAELKPDLIAFVEAIVINPLVADPDWPFRRIDYILVRGGVHGGPLLPIASCARWLDQPVDGIWASDHFGVVADLDAPS